MGIGSRLADWLSHAPRPVRAITGALGVLLGLVVVFKPTTSLGLLALFIGVGLVLSGLMELSVAARGRTPESGSIALALTLAGAGLAVLVWPAPTLRVVAGIAGLALIVRGGASVISGLRRGKSADTRLAGIMFGLATVIVGLVALTWPDLTLTVLGVTFGGWLIGAGALTAWRSITNRELRRNDAKTPSVLRRWVTTVGAVGAIAGAVMVAGVSMNLNQDAGTLDAFYDVPADVPTAPGHLIRAEPFTRTIPADALAWRILYTTTNLDGSPAAASALVVVPRSGAGSWPVVDWNHGTTGYDPQCAPTALPKVLETGAFMYLGDVIEHGWALVATDYIGLGVAASHPYLIGVPSAHASLDAVRAAHQVDAARLGDQTVVWGHSQGGGAALWTGATAEAYAPDVALSGVAALAPAANLPGMVDNLDSVTGGSVFASFVMAGYAGEYDDVTFDDYIRPGANASIRAMSSRCLAPPGIFASVLNVLGMSKDPVFWAQDPKTGPLGARLEENIPPATIAVPLMIAQGAADSIVVPTAQDDYVAWACDRGEVVDYRRFAGLDHVPLVDVESPLRAQLMEWTADRFAGIPVPHACTTTDY